MIRQPMKRLLMFLRAAMQKTRSLIPIIGDLLHSGKRARETEASMFAGTWTNEVAVDGQKESYLVELELFSQGTSISGILSARNIRSGSELPLASFAGQRRGYRIRGEILEISHGAEIRHGNVQLELKHGQLEFRGTKCTSGAIPSETHLTKLRSLS